MRRGACESRIHHDHLGTVFLATQDMLHGHRMCLGGVAADEEHGLGIVHVVIGIGHGAVAPGIRHTGHCRGVADTRLVIYVVGAPQSCELAEQVGLLIAELG
jgi:hypothetical protein